MSTPLSLWSESAALDQLAAFVRACCPEVPTLDVYRARPAASPAKFGSSVLLLPLTKIPEVASPFYTETDAAQAQRWYVTITTAAAGAWSVTVLATAAPYVAGGGDTAQDIADGLRAAVDALALDVTTSAVAAPPPGRFQILGNTAGDSLGVSVTAPVGGAYTLTVEDDNIRRAAYNFGIWRVRVIFRDTISSAQAPASGYRCLAPTLADRFRGWLAASSLPVTNGSAYPYRRDNLQASPAMISWYSTSDPIDFDAVEGGVWTSGVGLDVEFQVPVALTHDVPSLDAVALSGPPVFDTD